MKRTSVILADDHVIFIDSLVHLIQQEFEIVGVVRDGRAMVELAKQNHPDVIVTDISRKHSSPFHSVPSATTRALPAFFIP